MNDAYAEVVVKRKDTMLTMILRVFLVFLILISFLLITLQNGIFLVIGAILIVGIIYLFPRLNIEYEYIYCDGQLDFDKIMGNSKRKTIKRIDFEQVEVMAPLGSHSLDGYTYIQTKMKNFTSNRKDVTPYVVIAKDGPTITKYLFEPNKKMIDLIKMKYSRKISEQ